MSRLRSIPTIYVALAVLAVAILVASVIPVPAATPQTDPTNTVGFTTLLHVIGYGTLAAGGVVAVARRSVPTRRSLLVWVVLVTAGVALFGVATEALQAVIPWRTFSVTEMALNAASAVAGGLLATMWFSLTGVYARQ